MTIEIGLQLFSTKKSFQENRQATLDKIAGIGYRHIEVPVDFSGLDLFGTGELKAEDLKLMTERSGLKVISVHAMVTDDAQIEKVIAYNHELGCDKVVIPFALYQNVDQTLAYAERLNRIGKQLHENGMHLYYHNHFQEFQSFDGKRVIDILMEHTDPELVSFEVDTYWALRAGVDVTALLEKMGSRCGMIHQKDLPTAVKPVNIFETIGKNAEITFHTFAPFLSDTNFTEIGQGIMDIQGIVQKAQRSTKSQYVIVEQDATQREELESVAMSFNKLRTLV